MNGKTLYFRKLDIIRIIYCILVLLYHLNIIKGGFLAVCTFFTLSGYLSCMSALKNKYFSIKLYYINRLKKIYFPLLIVVAVTVIFTKLNPSINWMNLKPETFSVLFGYNNFWQLSANQDYFTRNINSPFIHLWYISILFQFDLLFPLVFKLLNRIENKIKNNISTIVVVIFTIFTTILFIYMSRTQDFMITYYNSFARSFSIMFGILLALIHYKYNTKLSRIFERYNNLIFVIYTILLISLCIFLPNEVEYYAIFMILTTFISTRIIEYSTYESKKINRSDIYLKFLSRMTYEIYLVQYPVIFLMQRVVMNDNLNALIITTLTVIISFILYFIIEGTFKNKKIRITKNIFMGVVILIGVVVTITSKDYSTEMKALENRLNENLKFAEEKNKDFINNANIEKEDNNNTSENTQNQIRNTLAENNENSNENTESKKAKIIEKDIENIIKNMRVVGVGDSVLLDATKAFYNKFPKGYFDGKINRTISKSKEVLTYLKNKGKLGNIVILCLSTNGDYLDKQNTEMMKILGDRKVYWINAAGPDDPKFNEKFANFAKNYPNIHIIEWDKFAKTHPEYLEPDKIHPNYKGGQVLVQQVFDAICEDYLKE